MTVPGPLRHRAPDPGISPGDDAPTPRWNVTDVQLIHQTDPRGLVASLVSRAHESSRPVTHTFPTKGLVMRPSVPATVTAGVVALLLTACSGGATGGGGSSKDDTGPLSAYFEKLGGGYDEAKQNAQHRKSEEVIAECMAELGFEYTPTEPWSGRGAEGIEDLDWESLEFAEQYGYGYTTSEDLFGAPEEIDDPNQERLESMSDAEMEAYNEALWGPPQEVDEEDPEAATEWDWETAGCYGKGYYAAYEQDDPFSDETVEAAMEEWSKAWEAIPDDPAVRESLDGWASCMADEGHDFADPNEANSSIGDAYNALYTPAETEFDPEADPDATDRP